MSANSDRRIDEEYYEVAKPGSLSDRVAGLARDRIYQDFLRFTKPDASSTILDIGASDVVAGAANVLERKYPHPENLTAAGLGNGVDFKQAFPAITYVRIAANEPLPFPDNAFCIATCNAVLEHVGSKINQETFVGELLRVARCVFITVPHRYFPIEHHTGIPIAHWNDAAFQVVAALSGKSHWATETNLILMNRRRLRELQADRAGEVGFTGIPLGILSSNLFLYIRGS